MATSTRRGDQRLVLIVGVVCALILSHRAAMAQCAPVWNNVGTGAPTYVSAFAVFDDGTGPALYAGMPYWVANPMPLRKWNGASWSNLPSSPVTGVTAMAVHDGGAGGALYVAGPSSTNGTLIVVRWDGQQWTSLGSPSSSYVWAIVSHDDGSGAALYVGIQGGWTGDQNYVKRWNADKQVWTAVGSGTWFGDSACNSSGQADGVYALLSWDPDADGPLPKQLFAGGRFSATPNGLATARVAKWDGVVWSSVGTGFVTGGPQYTLQAQALAVFDRPGAAPPQLVAGTSDSCIGPNCGGFPSTRTVVSVKEWTGSEWLTHYFDFGSSCFASVGGPSYIYAVAAFDADGSGPYPSRLYAGGGSLEIVNNSGDTWPILEYAGGPWATTWTPKGFGQTCRALQTWDDGTGPALYAGGQFGVRRLRFPGSTCCVVNIAPLGGDNAIDVNDLLLVIGNWGAVGSNIADVNHDNIVDVNDLLAVVGAWGPCP